MLTRTNGEWYTPAQYTQAVHEVLGDIDLDPASCAAANKTVKATTYYTQEDNGLALPWFGRVFLNCPFSEQAKWSKKLLEEYSAGHITSAIFLAQAATERKWFQSLWDYPMCFTDHQILFQRPEGNLRHIYHGTCFIYMGKDAACFKDIFSRFGHVTQGMVYA